MPVIFHYFTQNGRLEFPHWPIKVSLNKSSWVQVHKRVLHLGMDGKILLENHREFLKKRGRILANRCFLCCEEEETIDHILIHCTRSRVLWELLFALFGVAWVISFSVRDTLLGWRGFYLGKKRRKVWKTAPLCIFWVVWKERNMIAFDNEELSIHTLKNSFVCNLWLWTKSVINEGPLPLLGFFYWPGASWGLVIFCIPSSFVCAFWRLLYTSCMLLG